MNKKDLLIGLTAGILAGASYLLGRRDGHNECLFACQDALLKSVLNAEKEETKETK